MLDDDASHGRLITTPDNHLLRLAECGSVRPSLPNACHVLSLVQHPSPSHPIPFHPRPILSTSVFDVRILSMDAARPEKATVPAVKLVKW